MVVGQPAVESVALVLATVIAHGTAPPVRKSPGALDPKAKVQLGNVLLLSVDKAVVNSTRKAFSPQMTFGKLEAKFPANRFLVRQWGKRSALVLDRELPLIAERAMRRDVLKTLLKHINTNLTIRLGDVPEDERGALDKQLAVCFPWVNEPDGTDRIQSTFGIQWQLRVTVTGSQPGASKDFAIPMPADQFRMMTNGLKDHVVSPRGRLSTEEQDRIAKEVAEQTEVLDTATYHSFGEARFVFVQGLRESATALQDVLDDIDKDSKATAKELLEKMGSKFRLDSLPKSGSGLSDLSPDLKQDLLQEASNSWQGCGFQSQADSLQFLNGAKSLDFSVDFSFFRAIQGPDSQGTSRGAGAAVGFASIKP